MTEPVMALMALAAAVALLLLVLGWRLLMRRRSRAPRVRAQAPMDRLRRDFHRTLRQALPRHVVLAEIGFDRFLTPEELNARQSGKLLEELGQHRANYLVCTGALAPVAVINIDDNGAGRCEALLREAALPLIRWRGDALPPRDRIAETIRDLESLNSFGTTATGNGDRGEVRRVEPGLGDTAALGIDDHRREPRL